MQFRLLIVMCNTVIKGKKLKIKKLKNIPKMDLLKSNWFNKKATLKMLQVIPNITESTYRLTVRNEVYFDRFHPHTVTKGKGGVELWICPCYFLSMKTKNFCASVLKMAENWDQTQLQKFQNIWKASCFMEFPIFKVGNLFF